jgi:hypothetical protein
MGTFDEMMSSARGPGVIGTLMALLVLVGFGALYFCVFDESMQGGPKSLESVIRNQAGEIDSLNGQIEPGQKTLEHAQTAAKEYATLQRRVATTKSSLDGLNASKETLGKSIDTLQRDFEAYRDRYRAQVRGGAAGTQYAELITSSGKTYRKVVVKKVDAVGMSFLHENGTGRADFDDLPAEVQDYFQYDPQQKEEAKRQEAAAHRQLEQQVVAAQAGYSKQQQEQAARDKEALYRKNTAEIQSLQSLITQLDSQISSELRNLENERRSVQKNGGVFNAAMYQTRLSNLRTRKAQATQQIADLTRAIGG